MTTMLHVGRVHSLIERYTTTDSPLDRTLVFAQTVRVKIICSPQFAHVCMCASYAYHFIYRLSKVMSSKKLSSSLFLSDSLSAFSEILLVTCVLQNTQECDQAILHMITSHRA